MPKVSIGLPVYNGGAYLRETLDAMLGQSFEDFEIIICDNASADDTEAICRHYTAIDSRIRYIRNPINIGAIKNHNFCFKLATGAYFKWNGHDDICLPTYLEKCVAVLDNDPSIVLCQTRTRWIDADGADLIFDPRSNMFTDKQGLTRIEQTDANYAQSDDAITRFQKALDGICVCQHVLGVMRSNVVRKTGLMGPYRDSDRAFLAEMVLHGKFAEVPEDLFLKREHPRNTRVLVSRSAKAQWAVSGNLIYSVLPPRVQEHMQIFSAILRSPLSLSGKAQCIGYGFRKAYLGRLGKTASVS